MRWYLRYLLSFRDVEELLGERGLKVDHTTIWRWVQRYGPDLKGRLRRHLKPTHTSWRVDEIYVHVKGRWYYLYRALNSTGATIDFVLSGLRDAGAATRMFRKALIDPSHPQPRVINTDQARLYGSAIAGVKKEGILRRRCRHRPVQYLNNIVEQDHRAIKRRVKAKQGCVATFQKRQESDWSSRPGSVSCRHLEQVVDELNLSPHIRTAHPPRLPLPDHVHGLVALDRSPRRLKLTKPLLGFHASFDRAMILLQDVVQVLDRPVRQRRRRSPAFFTPAIAEP